MKRKFKKESFMQGVVALMFSQVLVKILGLAYKVYLTNKEGFGDAGNAIYNSGYQIYALLLTLSSIGVPGAIAKLVSERIAVGNYKGAHRVFKIAFISFAIVGLVGTLILFTGAKYIAGEVLQIPEAELTLVALSPSVFFVAIASVIRGYFNGLQNLTISAKSQTFEQLFKTVLTIAIVELIGIVTGMDTVLMAAGANLATTLAVMLCFGYIYIYYRIQRKAIWKEIEKTDEQDKYIEEKGTSVLKKILSVSIPMSLSAIISAINRTIDGITVVRGLKTFLSEEIAKVQYGILSGKADMLIGLPLSFNIAFATALVPSVSYSKAIGDTETIRKRVSISLLITMLIGLPCTIGLCVFSDPILELLFPNASDGGLILKIASFTIIFTVLAQTINGALQGLGKLAVPAIALGTGVLVKIILNLILVPMENIGILGAAASSVVCHIISFTIGFTVLSKNVKLSLGFMKFVIKPIIATVVMSIISYWAYLHMLPMFPERICTVIALCLAVVVYLLVVVLIRVFTKEEILALPFGTKIAKILEKIKLY